MFFLYLTLSSHTPTAAEGLFTLWRYPDFPLPPSLAAQSSPCSPLAISHSLSSKHLYKKLQSWWQSLSKCLADSNCQPCGTLLSISSCHFCVKQSVHNTFGAGAFMFILLCFSFTVESSCGLKPREVQAAIIQLGGSPQHMRADQNQSLQLAF